jgi:capsule polysaccharide modification protein KpsS
MENESFSKAMKIKCKAQTTVNSLNQEAAKEITKDDISYKININDGISCDLLKENNIVYCPSIKFDTFLKTFINTKDSKLETLN